ncbi:alpha/beta hydrolase [Gallaecimonas kandeliae]|uniref:alpha/beta hydrolase n=1 Tax=Gallaecimonas kandeliae TaxID=3029055 RepID=UPI002647C492|nr:alpha/beta fold hydrolase [Gallaecimonas kandeliae]WKE65859.1 alpha/beta hydrolase [Gallaecimonas kandeliae]
MKKLLPILALCLLQGCAAHIKESNFIVNDKEPKLLSSQQLAQLEGLRPGLKVEKLDLKRDDGKEARGIWVHQAGSRQVLLYFSGNNMRLAEEADKVLPKLLTLGTDLVWVDHRGLGGSEGPGTLAALMRDADQTYDYVAAHSQKPVVLYGLSLGSFIAGQLALDRPSQGLVLESSATNVDDWVDEVMPWYFKPFTDVKVAASLKGAGNEKVVERYKGPLLVLVGDQDKTTPPELARKLYAESASSQKQLVIAKGRRHGNALADDQALAKVRDFVAALH